MKFDSIQIKNFLTIGEANIALGGRGLVLIQGENRDDTSADSNGSGKSSVVDALSWALYGATARGVTGDDVVNNKAKKNAQVTVYVTDGDVQYEILRSRKPNNLTLKATQAGMTTDLTKGTEKDTQEAIVRVMGASQSVFLAAVYAGQEMMPDLPGMTDKQLKVLIEEAAGVEILNAAYGEARFQLGELKGKLAGLAISATAAEGKLNMYKDQRDQAFANKTAWQSTQQSRIDASRVLSVIAAEEAKKLTAELNSPGMPSAADEQAALDALAEKLNGIKAEKALEAKFQAAVNDEGRKLASCMAKVEAAKRSLQAAEKDLGFVNFRIGTPCKECGKAYHAEDLTEAKARAEKQVNAIRAELLDIAKTAKEQRTAEMNAVLALKEFQDKMTDPVAVTGAADKCRANLAKIKTMTADSQRHYQSARDHFAACTAMVAEINPFIAQVTHLEQKVLQADKDKNVVDAEVKSFQDSLATMAAVAEVFGPAGVRSHILDTVTPLLNEKTSEYLGALSDGAITAVWSTLSTTSKGELREKFNIEVENEHGAKSFAGLSGGEKRKVRLACALALQDLVATRATKPIELFIADEVDHALDESGLERLMGVLETKARERGTVLVISHNSLSDWISEVITVVKEGGISKVEDKV